MGGRWIFDTGPFFVRPRYVHHVRDTRLSLHCCGVREPENEAKNYQQAV